MEDNELFTDWLNAINEWKSALEKNDIKVADQMQEKADYAYKQYKDSLDYDDMVSNASAAELGSMFEAALPQMFVSDKKTLGAVIRLIKEDANLKYSFMFVNALKQYNGKSDPYSYINEAAEIAKKHLDSKTFKKSKKTLADILKKGKIKLIKESDENKLSFLNGADFVLLNKIMLSNLSQMTENKENIKKYIEDHHAQPIDESVNNDATLESLYEKVNALNENDKQIFQDIIGCNSDNDKKKQLFDEMKDECISLIDEIDSDEEREQYCSIKENLEDMKFDSNTIVEDITKFLKIGGVISDKKID